MFHGKSARKDGLGRIFVDTVTGRHVIGSTVTMIILFAAAFFAFLQGGSYTGYAVLFALLFVSQYVFCIASVQSFGKRFSGLTGDTLGAMSEASEIIFLIMVCGWLRHSFS
jgi:adenosylcobinamide-GDP ribazoletransferase